MSDGYDAAIGDVKVKICRLLSTLPHFAFKIPGSSVSWPTDLAV